MHTSEGHREIVVLDFTAPFATVIHFGVETFEPEPQASPKLQVFLLQPPQRQN